MIHLVRMLFFFVAATGLLFMLAGLYKPWIMLWWEDTQSRRKVIKLYGSIALASYCVYWILFFFV